MDIEETADDLALENSAKVDLKEDEVRAAIVTEYGFDEEADKERIDKLTKKEMDNSKKLSQAIGQKIKYRDAAKNGKVEEPKPVVPAKKEEASVDVDTAVAKQLEKRDLEDMPYSEDLKKEIQRIATIQNVSVKAAARDPYIAAKIAEEDKAKQNDDASIGNKNKSGNSGNKKYSIDSPPDVDMSTPEGRAEWDKYKKAMKDAGN